jgi:drug/metabolite transporter (DMT)-like permease
MSPPASATSQPASPAAGIAWMLVSALIFSTMPVTIREATAYMHPLQTVFFRNAAALAFMSPWLFRVGLAPLRTSRSWLYATRALTAAGAMMCWFWGMPNMPLGAAQALSFTQPMFATVLAALVLREDVRARRWSATALGFVGVLIIVQPGVRPVSWPEVLVMASALFGAVSAIQVKALARTEGTATMVAYLALFLTPMTLLPAIPVWTWPPLEAWGWIVLMGAVGTAGHLAVTKAYHLADASALLPFDYLRLPLAALLGWAIYAETLGATFWLGSAVIAGSSIYIAHREAAIRRREAGRAAAGLAGDTVKSQP